MHCWHSDGSGLRASKQFFQAGEGGAAKLRGHSLRLREILVHYGHQLHALALFLQFVVDAGVVPSKGTHTNDCYADWTFVSQSVDFLES